MSLGPSKRGIVPPFIVMDVMRAANEREAQGENIMHLEVGQPGTGAPQGVIDAVAEAVRSDRLGYTDALGIAPLRQAIAGHYRDFYGLDVPAERIAVTMGSSGGFILSFLAAFDAGQSVALAAPGYPAYRNILTALGLEVVEIPVGPDTNFQPTPAHLEALPSKPDGLIVASPSNPTGTMLDAGGLAAICGYCDTNEIRLVSDEIYHGITYGERAESALRFTEEAIVVNSFSKYFSMTGWRLGWLVVPPSLVRAVECLAQNLFISAPAVSQTGALAVFDCKEELEANVQRYAANRELLLSELPKAGFDKLASADGAFYIYADVTETTNDSAEFCSRMLAEAGVAATPGTDFDPARGHRFVRFSFARDTTDIAEAADRLKRWRA